MKVVDVPAAEIAPHEGNPNVMDDETYEALVENIRLRGFVQPILVRKVPVDSGNPAIRYRIVNGEHRWQALSELGAETIPCVVVEVDEVEAGVRNLTMNRLRGEPVPVKLAHLLADLTERIPEAELRRSLALDKRQMREYLKLVGVAPAPPERGEAEPKAEASSTVVVTVLATPKQAERIVELLEAETGGDDGREAAVIARKAREYVA